MVKGHSDFSNAELYFQCNLKKRAVYNMVTTCSHFAVLLIMNMHIGLYIVRLVNYE